MSLELLIVHSGQRISTDASITSIDSLKSWITETTNIPAAKQILLTASGKQAKVQSLRSEVAMNNTLHVATWH